MKRFGIFACLAALLLGSAACAGPEGQSGSVSTAEGSTEDNTTAVADEPPVALEFSGGAVWSDGTLSAEAGKLGVQNTAAFTPDRSEFRLTVSVLSAGKGSGAICFKSSAPDDGYRLVFSHTLHKVTLYVNDRGFLSWKSAKSADIREGVPFDVTLDFNGSNVKVSMGTAEDPADNLLFDLDCKPAGDLVIFDCGSLGGVSFSGIGISEVPQVAGATWCNPVIPKGIEGADPFILCYGGKYYMYATNAAGEGYKVKVSEDLANWTDLGFCLRDADVYGSPTATAGFWAPEVYAVTREGKERFLMLYTVDEHVGAAFADSPEGPFRSEKNAYLIEGHKAIDATLFTDDNGKSYIYYVGFGGVDYGIYCSEIDLETLKTSSERRVLSPDGGSWETREGSVTEGPAVLKHKGKYYLTYSGNGYTSKYYAIGYAVSDSPFGPFVKAKENPILEKTDDSGVFGPGHHGFFYTPGGHLMLAYHRHLDGSTVHPRSCCIDRVVFVDVGEDHDRLVIAGPTVTPQPIPD